MPKAMLQVGPLQSKPRSRASSNKPPKPDRVWNRIPDDIRQPVVMMAFEQPELSPRELATRFTDTDSYYVSESSVYRLLKAHDLMTGPDNRKAAGLKAHHQLENSCQWFFRFDMNDGFGHHFGNRPSHQLVVMGHHLTGGEGKGSKKIELCDDSQHLFFFHHRERIEIVVLE